MKKEIVKVEESVPKVIADPFENQYKKLTKLLADLQNNMIEIGKTVCELLEKDPDARARLSSRLSPSTIKTFEKLGRGLILTQFIERPRLGNLPIDEQNRIVNEEIEVALLEEGGDYDTVPVKLAEASGEILDQVLAKDHIRTVPEQIEYLKNKTVKETNKTDFTQKWNLVAGGGVVISTGVYSLSEVRDIYKAMSKK